MKDADKKTITVKVLLSPNEMVAFRASADAEGVKVSTWMRLIGRRASGLTEVRAG